MISYQQATGIKYRRLHAPDSITLCDLIDFIEYETIRSRGILEGRVESKLNNMSRQLSSIKNDIAKIKKRLKIR